MADIYVIIVLLAVAGVPGIAQDPTEPPTIELEARVGDTIILPCDQLIPTPSPDFTVNLFILRWRRPETTDPPFYLLFDSTDPVVADEYAGRVELVDPSSDPSLRIMGVRREDAGIYECQIIELLSNLGSLGNGTFVRLVILGPPQFVSTPPEYVVFQERQDASLECEAQGVPTPTITWYRQGEQLAPSNRIKLEDNSITIKGVERNDIGSYACQAQNSEGSVTNITRFVVEGPPHIFVPPEDTVVTLGQAASFDCEALASPSNVTQHWSYEGVPILDQDQFQTRVVVHPTTGGLTIKRTRKEDQGVFTCTPTNGLGTPPTASAYLDVQYAAEVVAMPTEVYSTRGGEASIPCNVTANPALLYVIWRKDETEIRITQTNRYSTTNEGSLVIEGAVSGDEGAYSCTPYNDLGTAGQSTPTTLRVIDPPGFSAQPDPMYSQSVGDSVQMPCTASGSPTPTLSWKKVNGRLSSRAVISGAMLEIRNITKEDHGTYECLATNQVATVIASTDLVVSPTSPHIPSDVAVVTSSTSAYISWQAGFDGGMTQTFSIRYRPFATTTGLWDTMYPIPETFMSLLLYDLSPSTTYEFTVTASNSRGSSGPSSVVTATTKDAEPFVHPTDSTGATLTPRPEDVTPTPPQNVTITIEDEVLLLSWAPPARWASYVDHYAVEYRLTGGPWLILEDRVGPDVGSVPLRTLQPNTTYQFRVLAFTVATFSEPSALVVGDTRV